MDLHNLIKQLIWWGPTVLFGLTLLISFLIGFNRGFRKSFILCINSFIAFIICLTLYFCLVNLKCIDSFLLEATNTIMGDKYWLQDTLGVSKTCETLREVILEALPRNLNFMDGLALILADNGQYLSTLVDLSFHLIFGVFAYILYYILIFIGYIIYLIFFKESKYMRKKEVDFMNGDTATSYRKRRLGGGFVGLSRGLVKGFINLSFLGMLFFIIAGGTGEREQSNVDLGNNEVNYIVDAYDGIGSYGTKGIYKILNMCKDPNDVPYYLFAADLVFQGKLDDPERHISDENVYFRSELASYTKFSRDTAELLLKYGDSDIRNAILYGTDDVWNILYPIFENQDFQNEFRSIIYEFDMGTYFINLTLSLAVSIAKHINELSISEQLDPIVGEIFSILFNKDYHCSAVPYEASLQSNVKLPTLDSTVLITREDVNAIFEIIICYVNEVHNFYENNSITDEFYISLIRKILPYISRLSILNTGNKAKIDPVLKRVYAYCIYRLFGEGYEGEQEDLIESSSRFYIGDEFENVSWIDEINYLLNICEDVTYLYEELDYNNLRTNDEVIDAFFNLFSLNNPNYIINRERIDRVIRFIGNSHIVSEVLTTKVFTYNVEFILNSIITDYKIPQNINYVNVYDNEGRLIEYGELYNLLTAVEALIFDDANAQLLHQAINSTRSQTLSIVKSLFKSLEETSFKGNTVINYISNSKIVNSLLTNVIYSIELVDGIEIYQDEEVIIEYPNGAKVIENEEFKILTKKFIGLFDLLESVIDDPSIDNIIGLLEDKSILDYFDSKIIAGTINTTALKFLRDSDFLVVPESALDNEIYKLIKIIQNDEYNINIKDLINGDTTSITRLLDRLDDSIFNDIYSSVIISATITKYLNDIIGDFVYKEVINNSYIYDSDIMSYDRYEILSMIKAIKVFDLSITELIDSDINQIIDKIKTTFLNLDINGFNEIWNSYLLSGIISKQIEDVLLSDTLGFDGLDRCIRDKAIFETENKLYRYKALELYSLKQALVESFGITDIDNISINTDIFFSLYISDSSIQPKIDSLYNSLLASYIIKSVLDDVLTSELIGLSMDMINYSGILEPKNDLHSYPIYSKNEIISFLRCVKEVFLIENEESMKNLNYNDVIANLEEDDIDIIYESIMWKFVFAINFDLVLTEGFIDTNLRDSNYVKEYIRTFDSKGNKLEFSYYRKEELKNIITANKKLGIFVDGEFVIPNQASLKELDDRTSLYNSYIILGGGDFTVEVVKYASMVKDNDYDFQCILIQFASTNQATMYYDLRIESRIEDSVNKFYKSSDVVVIADNEEVIDILGYDFK